MLRRLRHSLVLILFCLLPFHALFVTVGTRILLGPGHPPMALLAVWKELLIVVIFACGIVELASATLQRWRFQYTTVPELRSVRGTASILKTASRLRWTFKLDAITWTILALLGLGIVVSATHYSLLTTHFVFGFKYLLLPLIFFLVLRSLSWDPDFLECRVFPALLVVSAIVAAYGTLTFLPSIAPTGAKEGFLPQSFFSLLGYSDAHSLYSSHTPLSAFQLISGTGIRRIQSTFAGPNQLGMWLLLPWSICLVSLLQRKNQELRIRNQASLNSYFLILTSLLAAALFLTFSRAAWIAAFVIALVAVCKVLRGPLRETILITLVTAVCVLGVALVYVSPQLFLRGISNQHHRERLRAGVAAILEQPLGRGLGSAGPASNRLQDACVYFPARTERVRSGGPDGADTSWARAREDLCIFVGKEQVQPPLPSRELPPSPIGLRGARRPASQPLLTERKCQCAFLPENWYLQVGVELGVLGLVLFAALIVCILRQLILPREAPGGAKWGHLPTFLPFLGLSIAALFLHAWEDSAVAYTVWGLAGIALAKPASPLWVGRLRSFLAGATKCHEKMA